MNVKRFLAVAMASTMVLGSTLTAFAEDGVNTATGTGTNTGHLDTDVFTAVLPTSSEIANFFDFTIDPENILASADKFTDNSTAASDIVNTDLVYFKQATGAAKAYASTSQAAKVGAKNYVDVDVTVTAAIGEAGTGKTIIPMVESAEALTAATEPSLFLQLKVGDQTAPISATGATATKKIAGQKTNFESVYDSTNKVYKLQEKSSVTWSNNTADVQLVGKVKGGTVDSTLVAPTVTLTWSVAKHVDGPQLSINQINATNNEVTVTGGTVSSLVLNKTAGGTTTLTSQHYTYKNDKITFTSTSMLNNNVGATITVKYSDSDATGTLTIIANE